MNAVVDQYGLLKNINDAAKVAPFQPWARDLFAYRQRTFLKDDPMSLQCYPARRSASVSNAVRNSVPRRQSLQSHLRHEWRRQSRLAFHLYRWPRTEGRARGNADNPLYYGQAAGRWDGDTLVVDSIGFNERFWFSNGGMPHTKQLHLVERLTRTDMDTLKYEVTIDDPGAYTRAWTASWTLQWIAGEELPAFYCQDNRA